MDTELDEARIGRQIRELRKIKNLSLREMSDAVGVSIGYLSQLERGRSKIPIGVLKNISNTLGIHIHWFFQSKDETDQADSEYIVRAENRKFMTFPGVGITEELLSPNLAGPLELLLSTIEPGADSEPYSHDGAEAGFVLSGELELWINHRKFELKPGDSFSFKSTEEHRCANPGTEPTRVLWVITPPHY